MHSNIELPRNGSTGKTQHNELAILIKLKDKINSRTYVLCQTECQKEKVKVGENDKIRNGSIPQKRKKKNGIAVKTPEI